MTIFESIINNSSLFYELGACFAMGGVGYFTAPILKAKIKNDGFQSSDIPEAVSEGLTEYQEAFKNMESVIDDITINNDDTINFVKDTIKSFKTFK